MSQRSALAPVTNTIERLGRPMRKQSIMPPNTVNNTNSRLSMAPQSSRKSSIGPTGRQSLMPTSGRQSSFGVGRQSTIGGNFVRRSSSIFGRGKTAKSDPRPILDKQFIAQEVRMLITYLTSNGYDKQLSPRVLTNPSAKDFMYIVEFLYRILLDPTLKIVKLDEDVPILFKTLKYPFQMTKSALMSVGSPHGWPSLLAALSWMVELANYHDAVEAAEEEQVNANGGQLSLDSDPSSTAKLLFELDLKAYNEYLAGAEFDDDGLDAELIQTFENRNEAINNEMRQLEALKAETQREIEQLTNEPNPLDVWIKNRQTMEVDATKFRQLIQNLNSHKATLEQKLQELRREDEQKSVELMNAQKEKQQYQETVALQAENAVDFEKMTSERTNLEEQLIQLGISKETAEKLVFDSEIQNAKRLEEIEKLCQQFNSRAQQLQLVPNTAKYAKGVNYQLSLNPNAPQVTGEVLKETIKIELAKLQEELYKETKKLEEEYISLQAETAIVTEKVTAKVEEVASYQKKIQQMETSYNKSVEILKEKLEQKQLEVDSIVGTLNRVKESGVEALAKSKKQLSYLKEQYESVVSSCRMEQEKMKATILKSLDLLVVHKSCINDDVEALQKHFIQSRQNLASS